MCWRFRRPTCEEPNSSEWRMARWRSSEVVLSYNNNPGQTYGAGVGLILSDRARRALIGYEAVSDRVLTAQLRLKSRKLTIICVYIPQRLLSVEVRSETWDLVRGNVGVFEKEMVVVRSGFANEGFGTDYSSS